MAATNFTPIILYHTTTASAAPTAGNLNNGELAINITDGKLFYKDNGGTVQVIATKGTGTIGGSNTQVQYNSSGALAGSANFTFNGTTATINTLNLTNALGTAYGGTALTTYTQGDLVYASAANTLAKLGIGANTYILTSTGSVPQWSAPSAVTVATANNLAGGAAGSVPYQSGASTTTFLSIGSAGQVLTSSGSAPQWSNLSSLGVTSLSFGTTGLTPSTATQGAITVAGTLATTNGGTGLTSFTANGVFYASSTSAVGQSANLTFDGTTLSLTGLNNTGNTTLGNAAADTLTVNSTITSNLIFTDNTYDIGASGATRPRNLNLANSLLINTTASGTSNIQDVQAGINATSLTTTTIKNLGAKFGFTGVTNVDGYIFGGIAMGGNGEEYAGIAAYDNGASAATGLKFFTGTTGGIVEAATVTSAGYWGFGVTSPSVKLDVAGDIKMGTGLSSSQLLLAGSSYGQIIASGGVAYLDATTQVYRNTAGSVEYGRFTSAGNLLVGTTSGAVNQGIGLTLGSSTGATLALSTSLAAGTTASPINMDLSFRGYANYEVARIRSWDESGSTAWGHLAFATATNVGSGVIEAMRINKNQYVGIRTTNPEGFLHVAPGNAAAASTAGAPIILQAQTGGSSASGGNILIGSGQNGSGGSNGYIAFGIGSSTSGSAFATGEAARISSGGNFGIGETSPSIRLQVAGPMSVLAANFKSVLSVNSTDSQAANTGAGVTLGGVYSGSSQTAFAQIAGVKENSTSGNYAGALTFYSRPNGDTLYERARITSTGSLLLGNTTSCNWQASSAGHITFTTATATTDNAGDSYRAGIGWQSGTSGDAVLSALITAETVATYSANLLFLIRNTGGGNFVERARVTSGGFFKASNAGTYASSTGSFHELRTSTNDTQNTTFSHTAASPYGIIIRYTAASPNNTDNWFWYCDDGGSTQRASLKSNGGLYNYSANDVNLSDRREKTNFAPAKSYLDTICAIPVQTFNYIDQSEDDPGLTLGVVAQDVQAVAPELVTESNWGTKDDPKMRLSIYQTDLQYALMKCIQELKSELDSVKVELATLKGN